jgi:hypothetical protein
MWELGETIWADTAIAKAVSVDRAVISDLRLPFEVEMVKSVGGKVVRLTKPDVKAANAHETEQDLDASLIDYTVPNDSTVEVLGQRLATLVDVIK